MGKIPDMLQLDEVISYFIIGNSAITSDEASWVVIGAESVEGLQIIEFQCVEQEIPEFVGESICEFNQEPCLQIIQISQWWWLDENHSRLV